jgi:acyl-CoA synthetase (AMP-forming)/AMP-acid ligase II
MLDNFASLWELVADTAGQRVAVVHGEQARTWAEFDLRAARLASALAGLGVGPGTTVAVNLRNSIENLEALFAAFKLRATPFNVNYRYRERELGYIVADAKPRVFIYDHAFRDRVLPAIERSGQPAQPVEVGGGEPQAGATAGLAVRGFEALIAGHDPAPRIPRSGDDELIIYTGGTTGFPKGVVWPHASALRLPAFRGAPVSTVEEFQRAVGTPEARAVRLVISPLMHAAGVLAAAGTLTIGGTVVFCTSPRLDPREVLGLVERHQVTGFSVIGDAIARPLTDAADEAAASGRPYDLSSVQSVMNTGGIWSAPVKKRLLRHGRFTIIDSLSATEAGGFATAEASDPDGIETARFHLSPNTRVLNERGQSVRPGSGEIGMLAMRGQLPKGYLNDPEKTAATWPVVDGVRYAMPGDLATVEPDGTITLLGRGSEVINTGGEKVFAEEVETVILAHPAVRDAIVVGLADERWGAAVTAVVAVRAGCALTSQELVDHVGRQLADYKRPRTVVFSDDVPRSPTGKADRPAARRLAAEATATS